MAEGTIDRLAIEVASSSSNAAMDIRELANSLTALEGSIGRGANKLNELSRSLANLKSSVAGVKLDQIGSGLQSLTSAMAMIPGDSSSRITPVIQSLRSLGEAKMSSSLANNINTISTALSAMPANAGAKLAGLAVIKNFQGVTISSTLPKHLQGIATTLATFPANGAAKLTEIGAALASLRQLDGVSIKGAIGQLEKLPSIMKQFDSLDTSSLSKKMRELNDALTPLSGSVKTLAAAYSQMPTSMRSAAVAARSVTTANKNLATSSQQALNPVKQLSLSLNNMRGAFMKVSVMGHFLKRTLGSAIQEVNYYIENMNLFDASMGKAAISAREFGNRVQELMGIDFGEWARNQGVFMTLATGMGVTADKAAIMSQNLTQLGYDISSFYNLPVADAMTKLQSGIAGELEPLRRIGWDLSVARMNLELTKMGIEANANTMTQAEKVALRYKLIMEQVTQTHGDMARTIASPANQIRILQAQVTLAARAIGNLFIPALNMILPVAIGAMKAIRALAQTVASLFGIDATFEVDYSGLDTSGIAVGGIDETADAFEDVGSAAEDATKRVKEYQNTVMGFDELNKLNATPEDTSADSGGGGAVGDVGGLGNLLDDIDLPVYDFLKDLDSYITRLADHIRDVLLQKVLPVVVGVGTAIAAWKIGSALINNAGKLSGLLRSASNHAGTLSRNLRNSKLGGGLSRSLRNLELKLLGMAGTMSTIAALPKAAMATFAPWVAAIALVAGHFANLAINSENFQRGFQKIRETVENIPVVFENFKINFENFFAGIAEWFKGWWDGLEVSFPWLQDVKNVFAQIAEFVQPAVDAIDYLLHDVFDIQWTDALMGAGIALAALTGNPAIAAFLAAAEAISLAIRGIGWAVSPVIESEDALADVTDETAQAFGTSLDSMEQSMQDVKELEFGDGIVSEEDVEVIAGRVQDIHDTIVNNLDARKNEELAAIDALAGVLPEEQVERLKQGVEDFYAELKTRVDEGTARIMDIYKTHAEDHTQVSEGERQEIERILKEQMDQLMETSGAGADEIAKINDAMANNEQAAAARAAVEVLKSAREAKDGRIADAEATADGLIRAAEHSLEAGDITEEEYENLVTMAENTKEDQVRLAEETYDEVEEKTREGLGDLADRIDWDTGEILTNWESFCGGLTSWWDSVCQNLSIPAVGKVIIDGNEVEFTGQDMGYYGGGYATGGFPTSGQLFVAREDGNPELVGRMGRRTAVANTGQIVEGIEAGVTNAMLQVLPAFSADNNSGDATMILNVDGETLARAVARGNASAMRRGQLKTELAFA